MLNFTGKLKLVNQASFIGKWILQTLLLVDTKLSCRDSGLFIFRSISVLKEQRIVSAFLKVSLWSTEAGPKIGLKQQFQITPDGCTQQNFLQDPDLEKS